MTAPCLHCTSDTFDPCTCETRCGYADCRWWAWLPLRNLPGIQPDFVNPMTVPRLLARALVPVRLTVSDACYLLRSIGYGDPITDLPVPASTPGGNR